MENRTYEVLTANLDHDRRYEKGEPITLTDAEAQPLLAVGAVALSDQPISPVDAGDPGDLPKAKKAKGGGGE